MAEGEGKREAAGTVVLLTMRSGLFRNSLRLPAVDRDEPGERVVT